MADAFGAWWYYVGNKIKALPDTSHDDHVREVARKAFEAGFQQGVEDPTLGRRLCETRQPDPSIDYPSADYVLDSGDGVCRP